MSYGSVKAHWPDAVHFNTSSVCVSRSAHMASVVGFSAVKQIQVETLSFTSVNFANEPLKTDFVTGLVKKGDLKSKFNIFTWDFKITVRLNRNLNLIFTYN